MLGQRKTARSCDADCRADVVKTWLDYLSMAETYFAHELKALLGD